MTAASRSSFSVAYWPEMDKVFILIGGFVDDEGTYTEEDVATMLIYDGFTGSWSIHKLTNVNTTILGGLTYWNFGDSSVLEEGIFFYTNNHIMRYDETAFKDEDIDTPGTYTAIPYEIQSTYTNLNNQNKFKKLEGFEPIIKTDFDGSNVTMKAAADFGRKLSQASSRTLLDGYQIPFYNVGTEGAYLQWRMLGESDTTSSDGLKVFSVGMNVK